MPTLAQASNFEAAFVVIGTLVLIGAPVLYWIFFKMDESPVVEVPDEPVVSSGAEDLALIERELGVSLPPDYAAFQRNREAHPRVDNTTVMDCAAHIIETTQDMRLEWK
ncbi:MAG: hypothetical protein ACO1TE_27505 [Prosthecobacter sp.]